MMNVYTHRRLERKKEEIQRHAKLQHKLQITRDNLSYRSRERAMNQAQQLSPQNTQSLLNGAMKSSLTKPRPGKTIAFNNSIVKFDGSLLEPDKTYHNEIYVRKYMPDQVRRQTYGPQPYLADHLGSEPHNGKSSIVNFKTLLKPRTKTAEKGRPMTFIKRKLDPKPIDNSFRDTTMLHNPDFRPDKNFNRSCQSAVTSQRRQRIPFDPSLHDSTFNCNLKKKFNGRQTQQAWIADNNSFIAQGDPYIDGFENMGKLERERDKSREMSPQWKEASVNNLSKSINKESLTLRNYETEIMLQRQSKDQNEESSLQIPLFRIDSLSSPKRSGYFSPSKEPPAMSKLASLQREPTLSQNQSKVYFKSLEMGTPYHQFKSNQKAQIETEIKQIRCKSSMDKSPYASSQRTVYSGFNGNLDTKATTSQSKRSNILNKKQSALTFQSGMLISKQKLTQNSISAINSAFVTKRKKQTSEEHSIIY